MSQHQRIERVDNIPLILYWLKQMGIVEIIDATFTPHTNWQSLSNGQLVVLFLTYVLHKRIHCLSAMEEWVQDHQVTLVSPVLTSVKKKRLMTAWAVC